MPDASFTLPIEQRVSLPGHFDVPVVLEDARALGNDGSGGYECRVRLPDGSLDEAVISAAEAQALLATSAVPQSTIPPVDAERLRLLIESARIRLAYAHDRQFAVSLSGIRTLPHQIEAVYQRMLPQPRLRFLLADDPGAGKTIMAGLLVKELKLREAIERVLILCPAPLTIQWQDEMLRWFGEPFDIIFAAVDQQQLVNPFLPPNGQLRHAVEPDASRTTSRPHSSHRARARCLRLQFCRHRLGKGRANYRGAHSAPALDETRPDARCS